MKFHDKALSQAVRKSAPQLGSVEARLAELMDDVTALERFLAQNLSRNVALEVERELEFLESYSAFPCHALMLCSRLNFVASKRCIVWDCVRVSARCIGLDVRHAPIVEDEELEEHTFCVPLLEAQPELRLRAASFLPGLVEEAVRVTNGWALGEHRFTQGGTYICKRPSTRCPAVRGPGVAWWPGRAIYA